MQPIRIFVEGKADKKFLEDYFFHLTGEKLNDVRVLGGYSLDGIRNAAPQFLAENINLLIVDADYEHNGGTFARRKAEIETFKKELNIPFSLFLFPNNADDGDLEELLSQVINPANQDIFDCWKGYETCLDNSKKGYTIPAAKTKIYGYLEALLGKSKSDKELIKEEKRDYINNKHWDLNSHGLKPLETFLKAHFVP